MRTYKYWLMLRGAPHPTVWVLSFWSTLTQKYSYLIWFLIKKLFTQPCNFCVLCSIYSNVICLPDCFEIDDAKSVNIINIWIFPAFWPFHPGKDIGGAQIREQNQPNKISKSPQEWINMSYMNKFHTFVWIIHFSKPYLGINIIIRKSYRFIFLRKSKYLLISF